MEGKSSGPQPTWRCLLPAVGHVSWTAPTCQPQGHTLPSSHLPTERDECRHPTSEVPCGNSEGGKGRAYSTRGVRNEQCTREFPPARLHVWAGK